MNEKEYLSEMVRKLLDQSSETQRYVVALDKKVDLHIQKTELQLDLIQKLDLEQNAILEEHHKRSTRLEEDNRLREHALRLELAKFDQLLAEKMSKTDVDIINKRISKIEKPREWLKIFGKVLIALGTGAGALYTIYQLIELYLPK